MTQAIGKMATLGLGVVNIILGLLLVLIIFMMQGFYLVLLSLPFFIFGIALLKGKFYTKLLFYGIIKKNRGRFYF